MMEEDAKRRLKTAELQAKKDRLKIWTTYVPPQTKSTAILDVNFSGKVRGGCVHGAMACKRFPLIDVVSGC